LTEGSGGVVCAASRFPSPFAFKDLAAEFRWIESEGSGRIRIERARSVDESRSDGHRADKGRMQLVALQQRHFVGGYPLAPAEVHGFPLAKTSLDLRKWKQSRGWSLADPCSNPFICLIDRFD